MFSITFLNKIRSHELDFYRPFLPAGAKVLEIGGGTGIQALALSELGLAVTSVEVSSSTYSGDRVFPIIDYDGKHLPFGDNEFDIVFSSNVLEHILHLDGFHSEMNRVLKNEGYMVHAMPSGAWRAWTNLAHYVEFLQRMFLSTAGAMPRSPTLGELRRLSGLIVQLYKLSLAYAIPPRHGERGNCISEIYTFSRASWVRHFKNNHYKSVKAYPMGLFYTGHMVFNDKLSLPFREILSKILGSACVAYICQKRKL